MKKKNLLGLWLFMLISLFTSQSWAAMNTIDWRLDVYDDFNCIMDASGTRANLNSDRMDGSYEFTLTNQFVKYYVGLMDYSANQVKVTLNGNEITGVQGDAFLMYEIPNEAGPIIVEPVASTPTCAVNIVNNGVNFMGYDATGLQITDWSKIAAGTKVTILIYGDMPTGKKLESVTWAEEGKEVQTLTASETNANNYIFTVNGNGTLTFNLVDDVTTYAVEVVANGVTYTSDPADLSAVAEGTTVTISNVVAPEGQQVKAVKWGETTLEAVDGVYTFTVNAAGTLTIEVEEVVVTPTKEYIYRATDMTFTGVGAPSNVVYVPATEAAEIIAAENLTIAIDYTLPAENIIGNGKTYGLALTSATDMDDNTAAWATAAIISWGANNHGLTVRFNENGGQYSKSNANLTGEHVKVVYVMTADGFEYYVNGAKFTVDTESSADVRFKTLAPTANSVQIGMCETALAYLYPFNGTIHSITYYNKGDKNLTAEQFNALFPAEEQVNKYAVEVVANGVTYTSDPADLSAVAEGTTVTISNVVAPEGQQVKAVKWGETTLEAVDGVYTFTVNAAGTLTIEVEEVAQGATYCTDAFTGSNTTTSGRKLNSITLNGTTVSVNQSTNGALYFDKTDVVVTVKAGATYTPSVSWSGEWMHGYFFIDYSNQGTLEPVSYTYYDGQNSAGESVGNSGGVGSNFPAFTIPADLEPGTYRMRLKIDWNSIDPCEATKDLTNGGSVTDFTLNVEAPATYTVTVEANEATYTLEGADDLTAVVEGTTLTLSNVVAPEGQQVKAVKWGETTLEAVDGVYTFTVNAAGTLTIEVEDIPTTYTVTVVAPENVTYELFYIDENENEVEINSGAEVPENSAAYILITAVPEDKELDTVTWSEGEAVTADGVIEVIAAYTFDVTANGTVTVTLKDKEVVTPDEPEIPAEDGLAYGKLNLSFDGTTMPFQVPADKAAPILAASEATIAIHYTLPETADDYASQVDPMAFFGAVNSNVTEYMTSNQGDYFAGIAWDRGKTHAVGTKMNDNNLWFTRGDDNLSTYGYQSGCFVGEQKLVIVCNADANHFYLNGTFIGSATRGSNAWPMVFSKCNNLDQLYIGGFRVNNNDVKYPFTGDIHSIRFYTKTMTAEEVAALNYDFSTEPEVETYAIEVEKPENVSINNYCDATNGVGGSNIDDITKIATSITKVQVDFTISTSDLENKEVKVMYNETVAEQVSETNYGGSQTYYTYTFETNGEDGKLSITLEDKEVPATPVITTSATKYTDGYYVENIEDVYAGVEHTYTLNVKGENLTEDIAVSYQLSGDAASTAEFAVSTETISKDAAMSENGSDLVVTFNAPAESTIGATITLKSGETTIIVGLTYYVEEAPAVADKALLIPATDGTNHYQFRFDDAVLGDHVNGTNNTWVDGAATGSDNRARNFTMSAWVKAENLTGQIMGHGQHNMYNAGGTFGVYINEGKLQLKSRSWYPTATDGGKCDGNTDVTSDLPVVVGKWMFVTVVVDDTNKSIKLYKNGTLAAEQELDTYGIGLLSDECVFFVGNGDFSGYVDEVQVWNKALNAEEIIASMGDYLSTPEGMVAHYNIVENETPSYTNTGSATEVSASLVKGTERNYGWWVEYVNSAESTATYADAHSGYILDIFVEGGHGTVTIADKEGNAYESGDLLPADVSFLISFIPEEGYKVASVLTETGQECIGYLKDNVLTTSITSHTILTVTFEEVSSAIDAINAEAKAIYYANGKLYNYAGEIAIYDVNGKLIDRTSEQVVDVTGLANGVYIVRSAEKTVRFVK